jgi:uncharacterized Zn finger protein
MRKTDEELKAKYRDQKKEGAALLAYQHHPTQARQSAKNTSLMGESF